MSGPHLWIPAYTGVTERASAYQSGTGFPMVGAGGEQTLMPISRVAISLCLRSPWDFVRILSAWLVLSTLFGSGLLLVIDKVPLGPEFEWALTIYLADAIITGLGTVLLIARGRTLPRSRSVRRRRLWTLRRVLISLAAVALVAAIWVGGLIVWNDMRLSRVKADAASARQEFRVFTYGDDLDQSRLDRTLAEFEKARQRLGGEWPRSQEELPIELHLFRDIQQYHDRRGRLEWAAGSAYCGLTNVAIAVPLEEALGVFSSTDHSGTPTHEMVHAMMCQSLGGSAYFLVPSWFHEGMAQLYQNEGHGRILSRVLVRGLVWYMDGYLPAPETFCNKQGFDSPDEVALFYFTAMEFVRFLEARHGRDTLNAVVGDVASGGAIWDVGSVQVFDDSLRDRLGGACTDLYGDWVESW